MTVAEWPEGTVRAWWIDTALGDVAADLSLFHTTYVIDTDVLVAWPALDTPGGDQ